MKKNNNDVNQRNIVHWHNIVKNFLKGFKYNKKTNSIFFFTKKKFNKNLIFFLKKNSNTQFKTLTDLSAIHKFGKTHYLIVILTSKIFNNRILIKTQIENQYILTLSKIFSNSNWLEREVWDMFGIFFKDHSDLRRILTDYGFLGHPLNKTFPLMGIKELRYDESKKLLIYEPLEFSQEFRYFNFNHPWIH